jgi:dipeptidyl aminopeptidase/acylaminoacyl peptidase
MAKCSLVRHALVHPLAIAIALGVVVAGARAEDDMLARFMKIRAPGSPSLAENRMLYVVDWPDGVNQLYRRPAREPVEAPWQRLTDFEDGISGFWVSPVGRTIVVAAATGGNEQADLYAIDASDASMRELLVDGDVVYAFQHWLPDGSGFLYSANDASPSDFHIYRYDLATNASTKVLEREGWWGVSDVYDDARRALVGNYKSVAEAHAYDLNLVNGDLMSIDVREDGYNWPAAYMPEGRVVSIVAEGDDGQNHLYLHDLETHEVTRPMPDLDPYEIEGVALNRQRSLLAVSYNRDGYREMRLVRLPEFTAVELPEIEPGLVGDVEVTGRFLTWTTSNARSPGLTYAWKVGTAADPLPLTKAEDQGIDLAAFTLPQLVRYPSFDGREIPAFLYTPPGHAAGTPIPFVLIFHGGPEGQSRPQFSRTAQYLLSRGFGVMLPNVRGSMGYGRAFHLLDNAEKRWDSVRDGVAAAQWLVDQGHSERGRIASFGGSYGGFMAVATVIEGGDLFGAAIDMVGIVNFRTFLEQTKSYRRALREVEYGSLSDPDMLEEISPIHRASEIDVPVMIAHGLNDPRVPVGEAMQLAVELQKRDLDPELLFFPDEGHGLAKLENRLLFYRRAARFLERHIGGE